MRQGSDVQPTKRDIRAARAIVIGYLVGAVRVGDVDLDDDEVRLIVEVELFDMFILQRYFEIGIQVSGESREPQRRKERVLNWPPVRTRSLRQRGEKQLELANFRNGGETATIADPTIPNIC